MTNKPLKNKSLGLQSALLGWFDKHQRVMPWRATKGRRANPYHVWLSEIMLQQTTVATVGPYFLKFIKRWPKVEDLAAADIDEVLAMWAGLGYYARARNLHKCAKAVVVRGGFPDGVDELLELPGIGPYTAAAIASIAFDQPAVAVDGNVERVVSRFFAITDPLPASKQQMRDAAAQLAADVSRPGDFTQAFMELGATLCTQRSPKCGICPWRDGCAARKQKLDIESLPRKSPKKAKPKRYGHVFVVTDARGRVLLQKRGDKGLYAGMYQLPTTPWENKRIAEAKAAFALSGLSSGDARLQKTALPEVRHSLTHFDLFLSLHRAKAAKVVQKKGWVWAAVADFDKYALPTVMRKALALAGVA